MQRTPPYEQVAEHYRQEIRRGALSAGDELPSTRNLAVQWDIAKSTAQRALDVLKGEGWIESRPGKPPIVLPQKPAP